MKVCILTEGGRDIGFGHITRSVSIWQGFEESGIVPQLIVNGDKAVEQLLEGKNYKVFDWLSDQESLFAIVRDVDIVFIDSYLANQDLYESVYSLVKIAVYVDDTKRIEYPAGVLLNGTMDAEKRFRTKRKDMTYLLGSNFTPLRKSFWDIPEKIINGQIGDVLITLGGNGQAGFVEKLLEFLTEQFTDFTYHIIIPSQTDTGYNFATDADVKIHSNLNESQMCSLMLKCDVCISAGGQTLYELARVGLATIAICFAENQTVNLDRWSTKGFISYVGWYNDENLFQKTARVIEEFIHADKRSKSSQCGRYFVDGQGVRRIVKFFLNSTILE